MQVLTLDQRDLLERLARELRSETEITATIVSRRQIADALRNAVRDSDALAKAKSREASAIRAAHAAQQELEQLRRQLVALAHPKAA